LRALAGSAGLLEAACPNFATKKHKKNSHEKAQKAHK
jgi:hypothetical protein